MWFDDDDLTTPDSDYGREFFPLNVPLDRAVVAEALTHLRAHSFFARKHWHRQIDAVLHWFARSLEYRRTPVQFGFGCTRITWLPHNRDHSGALLTDAKMLMDPHLHVFPKFQALICMVSDEPIIAHQILASLIVRRDWRLRDFDSIRRVRAVFDAYRPAFVQVLYETIKTDKRLREQSPTAAKQAQANAAARHQPILDALVPLKAQNTPRRHWAKLILKAISDQKPFKAKADSANLRTIQRVIRRNP